ncbi:Ig-like domain-containing protein [Rhodococcus sp. NPDC003322]
MARPSARRLVAAIGAVALATLGVGVVGAGTASAASTSATKTTDNIKVTKSVTPGTVGRGATVTYKAVFEVTSIVDRYITKITDVHPAGFEYVPGSAKVTSEELTSGPSTETPTPSIDNANNRLTVTGNWLTSDRWLSENKDVTFEVTYKVPDTAAPGTFDSGLAFDVATFQSSQVFNPMGVNVEVSAPTTTTTTTVAAPATARVGTAVDLVATVEPTPGGGTVQFKDNGVAIGAAVAPVNGTATLSHTFNANGAHAITAEFTGAGNHTASTSAPSTVNVTAPTSTVLSAVADAQAGVPVNLVAAVTPSPAGGTVQFKDNGTVIGTVDVAGGTATLTHTFTANGAHPITASFTGTDTLEPSSSAVVTVTVTGAGNGNGNGDGGDGGTGSLDTGSLTSIFAS